MKHPILFALAALSLPSIAFAITSEDVKPRDRRLMHFTQPGKCPLLIEGLRAPLTEPSERDIKTIVFKFDQMNYRLKTALQQGGIKLKKWRETCRPLLAESGKDSAASVARQNEELAKKVGTQSGELQKIGHDIKQGSDEIYDAYNKKMLYRKVRTLASGRVGGKPCTDSIDSSSTLLPQFADRFASYAKMACEKLAPEDEKAFNDYADSLSKYVK